MQPTKFSDRRWLNVDYSPRVERQRRKSPYRVLLRITFALFFCYGGLAVIESLLHIQKKNSDRHKLNLAFHQSLDENLRVSHPTRDFNSKIIYFLTNQQDSIASLKRLTPKTTSRHKYNSLCRFHSCTNQCTSLSVYLFPLTNQKYSKEFLQLYYLILHSDYYSPDYNTACFYLPAIDFYILNPTKVDLLYAYEKFAETKRKNFLIFSQKTNDFWNYSLGDAIIIAGDLEYQNFRTNFDISIPLLVKSGGCTAVTNEELIPALIDYQCSELEVAKNVVPPLYPSIDFSEFKKSGIDELEKRSKIYELYFDSYEKRIFSSLQTLQERYQPKYGEITSKSSIFSTSIAPDKGFTAIILGYARFKSLDSVIENLVQSSNLRKIIIIWNNLKLEPPEYKSPMIKVIKMGKNSLNNRFYPFEDIETECVLSIDDDINMLSTDELDFGYHTWREFSDRIVGFPSRLHIWPGEDDSDQDDENFDFRYESEWKNRYSMVLTGVSFYHAYCMILKKM